MTIEAPRDNLYRALSESPLLRADAGGDGTLMNGHFSVFDVWYRIDSWMEGTFMERVAPGAFKKTFNENRDQTIVQFDHGYDPFVGDAPLGPIDVLREDDNGAYYEVPLYDTDYNRDRVLPLLQGRLMNGANRGSGLGASFKFRVTKEEWVREPKPSTSNPEGVPERTIREVRIYEFGPVPQGASPSATSGVRSMTDSYMERELVRSGRASVAASRLAALLEPPRHSDETEPPTRHSDGQTPNMPLSVAKFRLELLGRTRA